MGLTTLKSKLLIGVTVAVLGSGFLISLLVTHHYSESLRASLIAQAQYLTRAVGLEAADLVLTHDFVGLQKLLDRQMHSNPSLAYLMVVGRDRVLAHTFSGGIPVGLLDANPVDPKAAEPKSRTIVTETGEHILDLAFPIFRGRAGILRVGYSESGYRRQVSRLRWKMAAFTLTVLIVATAGSVLFIRRITEPVTELAGAVERVDQGDLQVKVAVRGQDEVAALAGAFNHMVARLNSYTSRLEEKNAQLEQAHQQTRTFCALVRDIGSQQTFREVGRTLVDRFQAILHADWITLAVFNELRDTLFILSENGVITTGESSVIDRANAAVEALRAGVPNQPVIRQLTSPPFVPEPRPSDMGSVQALLLSHGDMPFGILLLACGPPCRCGPREMDLAKAMAEHAAGVIKRAVLHEEEIRELQDRLETSSTFCGMVGKDPLMRTVFKLIEDVAVTDATVLIQGESGTGKELVARAIHQQSPRKDGPFVVINCSAYPATLLESELFGHEKGAFTGANRRKPGRFEQADGGTVFLDEIGEVPLAAQIRLLRVLQAREIERLGGTETIPVNVRILAATNRDLIQEVKAGRFREDLFYRLNVIPVRLPPLAQRRNDIPLLARHFLRRFSSAHDKSVRSFSPDAMRRLMEYPWPGNVRELENTIEHAVVLAKGAAIQIHDLPGTVRHAPTSSPPQASKSTLRGHEKELLMEALEHCKWNKKEAAKRLGISRSTLYAKLKKYRITAPKA